MSADNLSMRLAEARVFIADHVRRLFIGALNSDQIGHFRDRLDVGFFNGALNDGITGDLRCRSGVVVNRPPPDGDDCCSSAKWTTPILPNCARDEPVPTCAVINPSPEIVMSLASSGRVIGWPPSLRTGMPLEVTNLALIIGMQSAVTGILCALSASAPEIARPEWQDQADCRSRQSCPGCVSR